jgi:hypothetical protein
MKPTLTRLFALLSIASLGAGMGACSGGGRTHSGNSTVGALDRVTTVSRELGPIDPDDDARLNFGHAASARETRKFMALVRRYFTAAAAGDGAKACSMLYFVVIRTTVVDEDGHMLGLRRGTTCAVVMSKLLKLQHRQVLSYLESLKAVRIRTDGIDTYIIRRVPAFPTAHVFSLRHDGRVWKIGQPLDEPIG